ncbi:auxin-responsive GH3 family protein, partial [Striga asiatica]
AHTINLEGGWVPKLGCIAPTFQIAADTNPIWVHELLDASGRRWNTEMVKHLFSEQESEAILDIDTIEPDREGIWRWALNKKGLFTVAASYSFLIKEKVKVLDIAQGIRSVMVDSSEKQMTQYITPNPKARPSRTQCCRS